jgi:hypothetical protein
MLRLLLVAAVLLGTAAAAAFIVFAVGLLTGFSSSS